MSRILLDTSAYSEHLRDHPQVKAVIQRASAIGLSVVSIGELRWTGSRQSAVWNSAATRGGYYSVRSPSRARDTPTRIAR